MHAQDRRVYTEYKITNLVSVFPRVQWYC